MKNCIITGGNSGIGYQAAKQMAAKGCHVTMICRNESAARKACDEISLQTGNDMVDYLLADLSCMADVNAAAKAYKAKEASLDVLINNAADFDLSVKIPVMTKDNLEKQFATNVAAPFLLSNALLGLLKSSGDGRIINISSKGLCVYPFIKLDLGNLNGQVHYKPAATYYQNKLALLMFSLHMRKLHPDVKIQAVRVTNVKVDLTRYENVSPVAKKMYAVKSKFSISPEAMARIYTMLATEDGHVGFLYDENGKEVKANRFAYNDEEQQKLYDILSGLHADKT